METRPKEGFCEASTAPPHLRVQLSKALSALFGNRMRSESSTGAGREIYCLFGLFFLFVVVMVSGLVLVLKGNSDPEIPFNMMNNKLRILSLS